MRLREHFQIYGASTLSTAELLSLALTSGKEQRKTIEVVSRLLDEYGVKWLRNASANELHKTAGLTVTQAVRLSAICELTCRFTILEPEAQVQIKSADDVANLLRPLMAHLDHEEFRVLLLDMKHHVVANFVLYKGTVEDTSVRIAEIFRQAVVRSCPRMIIAHSHPSGDCTPSSEDIAFTKQCIEAGRLLQVELLDHVIIGNPKYVSLKECLRWE